MAAARQPRSSPRASQSLPFPQRERGEAEQNGDIGRRIKEDHAEHDGVHRSSVFINGRDYADNDYVSTNFEGHRFTWRVTGLTESGTLKLQRIRVRPVDDGQTKIKLKGEKNK